MVCPTNLRSCDVFLFFAPSRLRVKDSVRDCVKEVSRKDARTLRFEKDTAGLVVNLTNLRLFDVLLFFAPWRLCVIDRISCMRTR